MNDLPSRMEVAPAAGTPATRKTVAIVNYYSSEHVARLLGSLGTEGIAHVVIVNNGDSPAGEAALKEAVNERAGVSLITGHANIGFGAGVNRAIERLELGDDDLVWVVNPDVVVAPGAYDVLAEHLVSGRVEIVSPLILRSWQGAPSIAFAGGRVDLKRGRTKHTYWGRPAEVAGRGLRDTQFMTGAAFMTTGKTWRRLGGFREDYFLYWEDADLSVRAGQLEIQMAVDCDTRVAHEEGGSSAGKGRGVAYYEYMTRNRIRFMNQWSVDLPWWRKLIGELETLRLVGRAAKEPEQRLQKMMTVLRARIGR